MRKLNLGCGSDMKLGYENIDIQRPKVLDIEYRNFRKLDLNKYPWPWPNNSIGEIYASHIFEHLDNYYRAFEECQRILQPGGRLIVVWPIGMNEFADNTHSIDYSDRWIWETPEILCGKEPWQKNYGFRVIYKDVSLHTHLNGIFGKLYELMIRFYRMNHGNGRWLFDLPVTSGEFTVIFGKT